MKRTLALFLAIIMLVTCFAACGGNNKSSGGQNLMVCCGPDPETIDPARNSSVDGAIMLSNAFSGLYQWHENEDGTQTVIADCAEEVVAPTETADGKYQYVITLKEGLRWSDGVELKASDFVYAWNRACDPATMADYQYIFDVIDGYDAENPALNIAADDEARTITIVTAALCPYFDQLLAFPTYMPVRKDIVEADPDGWALNPETYVSNGAFKMSEWIAGDKIVFVRNENYWDAENVKLESLTFALSDDDDAIFANYENGTYQYTTTVPISQIAVLKNDAERMNVDFFIGDYSGTYYLEFNVEVSFKPGLETASTDSSAWEGWTPEQNAEVRRALALLIDRNYIVDEITQAGEEPAEGFVPGMDDGTGKIFREEAEPWWSADAADLEANRAEAVDILKKYYDYDEATGTFTNFPVFQYSINPTSGNKAMCAAIQDMWDDYGINTEIDQRDWSVIQTALTAGDFTMSRLGWIADYVDPITFLEIFVSASGNNHPRLGKDGTVGSAAVYGPNGDQTWGDAYETLITRIKTSGDLEERAQLMYQAEAVLQDTYVVCPIYHYTNPYLCKPEVQGYLYSPLGFVYFRNAYIADGE